MSRELWALLSVLAYALLCVACIARHRRRLARSAAEAAALLPAADAGVPTLVLHASQTGSAEALAWQTARVLHLAGRPVRLLALGEVGLSDLMAASHALFVASTYGEGDAPDSAVPFARDLMARSDVDLAHLSVGVLALGDRSYAHFCGFGRALAIWLNERGAQALFAPIELDQADAADDKAGMSEWQHQLSHLAGTADLPSWEAPAFEAWCLVARRHLNPGSLGGAVFHLELAPAAAEQAMPDWEAGDLVQIQVSGDAQPREYTLASLPSDGLVHLMVRQLRRADGSLGLASGLLTQGLAVGDALPLRLRRHTSFRIGANADRPLILIGNGTGLAGLRAHLKARAAFGAPAAWLIYGERQAARDSHYADEIEAWQQAGLLAHIDRVFSRDESGPRYVQQVLADQRERLIEWIDRGAAIYVCGSLTGMAAGVHQVLSEVLEDSRVDELIAQGRYRRDVY